MWNEGYFTGDTYTYGYYRELSPFYLQYCLMVNGYDFPVLGENACHCELGYGQGVSVNIHAAAVAGHYVGTDFIPAHAAHANLLRDAAGTDAALYELSFEEMLERKDLPMFDSICLHGIWTWVSRENQQKIIEFANRYLKPGGILYNSYNCFPGWAATHPVRELFLLQDRYIRSGGNVQSRVSDALAFAQNMFGANPNYAKSHPDLENKIKEISGKDAHYVAHEYLNKDWNVMYFTEVAEMMQQQGKLDYACTATLLDALDDADDLNFPNETKKFLKEISHPLAMEEIRDYYINRTFRKDIYVKGSRRLSKQEQVQRILATRYVLLNSGKGAFDFSGYHKKLGIKEEITGAIIDFLASGNNSPKDFTGFLESHPTVSEFLLLVFLKAMVAKGTIAPCQPEAAVLKAKPYCDRLNRYFREKAWYGEYVNCLASPVTGCGYPCTRVQQMFLHLVQDGHDRESVPEEVQQQLDSQGQRLVKGGKVLPNREDSLKEMHRLFDDFEKRVAPLLGVLKII